jgi:hypothetical protein
LAQGELAINTADEKLFSSNGTSVFELSGSGGTTYTAGTNVAISGTNVISSTDTNTTYSIGDGGLTQKNFTTADNTKLDGIATSANNYSHPTSAGNKHIPTGGAAGQFLKYSSSGTAVWSADNNTTYSVGDGGLTQKNFTTADNTKLDGIATSANNYSLPSSVVHDTEKSALHATDALRLSGHTVSLYKGDGTSESVTIPDNNTTYSVGDGGLTQKNFTTADNTKLDGIETSATADQTKADIEALEIDLKSGGSTKLATTSSGIDVTGSVTCDGLTSNGNAIFSGTSPQIQIETGASHYNWQMAAQENISGAFEISSGAVDADATNDTYTPRLVIEASTGNVGIGTSSPSSYYSDNLVVKQSAGNAGITVATASNATGSLYFADGTSGDASYEGGISYTHLTGFLSLVSGGSSKLTILSAGNVGIGTTTPSAKLQVAGDIKSNGNLVYHAGNLSVGDGGLTQKNFTTTLKNKLDGIATSANNYSHPTSAGNKHIPTSGASGQFLKYSSSGTAVWASDNNTTYSANASYGTTLSGTEIRLHSDRRQNSTTADIYSGNTHDFTFYDASVGIRWYTAGYEEMRLENDGDLHVDGDVVAYSTTVSDERLKENIQPIGDALSKVSQLNGCTFTYTADGKESAGLIAQDVEKVLPSAVSEKELPLKKDDGEKYKVLQYDQTIGLLVEAIKELSAKVEELESKTANDYGNGGE